MCLNVYLSQSDIGALINCTIGKMVHLIRCMNSLFKQSVNALELRTIDKPDVQILCFQPFFIVRSYNL